jgi:hypothetical protein
VLKSFPTVTKYVRLVGNLKYGPKDVAPTFASWHGKPNANTGVDRGKTSVGIAWVAAVSDMPNTTSEKMTASSRYRFPKR